MNQRTRTTFRGYLRRDGSVGTRNWVAVISSVGCANEVAHEICQVVPGAIPITHHQGCTQLEPDIISVQRTLANIGKNPNFGAVLVVSLGCESVDHELLKQHIASSQKPVEKIVIQEIGGSLEAISRGIAITANLYREISNACRETLPIEKLVLGLKCGSSDFTSGISANPALGEAVDILLEMNATVIFGETTEIIGAEHVICRRALNKEVEEKLINKVRLMEERAKNIGVDMRKGQPTPGNIDGGLTTIEEKSLGAITKTGSGTITGILDFFERVQGKGLYMKDTPGREMEALTGLVAGGANIIAFTTGRGAPQGFPGVPVLKISGNPRTCEKLGVHIDTDVSRLITGGMSLDKSASLIYRDILEVASGRVTKAESLGYDRTMEIYTTGPVI